MRNSTIYLIIGLTAASVIGVILVQLALIRTGLEVNEERYDKSVQTALKQVAEEQEELEERTLNFEINSGFRNRNLTKSGSTLLPDGGGLASLSNQLLSIESKTAVDPASGRSLSIINYHSLRTDPYRKAEYYRTLPLAQRVNLKLLVKSLRTELTNQRIDGKVEYGVFDNMEARFVIHDSHYVGRNEGDTTNLANLYASSHRVSLFDFGGEPAGYLFARFAEKETAIWSSLWFNFAASLLFALIILASFFYTIYVIQRQKQISEMKTDFINNMTHEFKTPIATISLATDSIMSPKISGSPDKVTRFANIIKQENKRMNKQVEKVLQMAKLDRNQIELNLSQVDLHQLAENAAEYIGLQVEPRGGTVTTDLRAHPFVVEGDQTHLSNVINNLLDNANKYSPEAPVIEICTTSNRKGFALTIKDQGLGMSSEARKHIFDRFYRVHTGDRHDVKGFGLGLSYVKTIIEAHNGTVSVKSEPNKGSSFTVTLPYRQPATRH
jgi:two-component system phosphate regulon sensor histidine kinase PhoR